jgi:hypothetical protein
MGEYSEKMAIKRQSQKKTPPLNTTSNFLFLKYNLWRLWPSHGLWLGVEVR